eukprot:s2098_g1.t1
MALEDVLEYRFGKGVIGKWASGWFCLQNGQLEQYSMDENGQKQDVLKVFDLSDSNEFEFDAETFSKISLQCGNERVRLRGQPEQMRRWYERMRAMEVQASQTFQPPARPPPVSTVSISTPTPTPGAAEAAVSTPSKEPDSPRRSRMNSRASFFNKPLEHLKSNERLDPSVATSMLDNSKLRTSDLMRRVDTSGDGEISRSELRKGLVDVLGYSCSNDDFKELMRVLDADGSDSITLKDMDRALKRAAKGEDLMVEIASEAILHDAMIQVDTVMGIPITADTGDSIYVARAKWKDDEMLGAMATPPRPTG